MADERRRDTRRILPFGRSAVVEIAGRSHVVSLVDLSRGGAYLGTRVRGEAGDALVLKLLLPQGLDEMSLACTVVRRIQADPAGGDRIPGLAIRFVDLAPEQQRRLEEFVVAGGFRAEYATA